MLKDKNGDILNVNQQAVECGLYFESLLNLENGRRTLITFLLDGTVTIRSGTEY